MLSKVNKDIFEECVFSFYSTKIEDVETSLRSWSINKKNLYNLFGNRLKFSVDVVLEDDFFYTDIWKARYKDRFFRFDFACMDGISKDSRWDLMELCSTKTLTKGVVDKSLTVCRENGDALFVQQGTKVMKAIRKIIEFAGDTELMDRFVKFRDAVSAARTCVGKPVSVTFSIDPVDFLIMSENAHGWSTCYSNHGTHHHSPVAWMNSPYAIVAYIEDPCSDSKFILNEHQLPNMCWREMFLVNDDFVISGAQYPFNSNGLAGKCLKILAAELNLNVIDDIKPLDELDVTMYDLSNDFVYNDWMSDNDFEFLAMTSGEDISFAMVDRPTCLCCGAHLDSNYEEATEIYGCCVDCLNNNMYEGIIYPKRDMEYFSNQVGDKMWCPKHILESDYICLSPNVYKLKPMLQMGGGQ